MKVQYHKFCLNTQVEQAVLCAEDSKRLSSLSIQDLVQLKAELYGLYNLSHEEFVDFLNAPNRKKLHDISEMSNDEKRVAKALVRLNAHARRRMLKIANDYRKKQPTASKRDIHDLSFVFRNNGRDFQPYPEVKQMNAEVAWYHHQKLIALKKSVWKKFLVKKFDKALNSAKTVFDNCVSGLEYWLDDGRSQSSSSVTPRQVESIKHRLQRTH